MKQPIIGIALTAAILAMIGCTHRAPTISHVHIGHAMTGWHDTPNKDGLFIVAEKKATEALSRARQAIDGNGDLKQVQAHVAEVSMLTDGETTANGSPDRYGVKQALNGAVSHITYAATSPDTTANTRSFADRFAANATGVIDRCDLIAALSSDILGADSADEADLLAPEIEKLARANIHGEDLNGDGRIGSNPSEYGLVQLRQDIEKMTAREDPPYTTVSSWYLFNLIRLPDGSWKFRNRHDSDDPYGGGGGGGGGGY